MCCVCGGGLQEGSSSASGGTGGSSGGTDSGSACVEYTDSSCMCGDRVTRGPDWMWDDQDGGDASDSIGTVVETHATMGWCVVVWDKGGGEIYRVGDNGKYDLCIDDTGSISSIECGSVSCSPGQYASSGSCYSCPQNSDSPADSASITDCKCNKGSTGPDGGPCTVCAAGSYKSTVGTSTCTLCDQGTYSQNRGEWTSSSCLACPLYSTSPSGSNAASDCKCNQGYTGTNGEPCAVCPAGTYKDSLGPSFCSTCPSGASSPAGSDSINDCVCNLGFVGPNGWSCSQCEVGTYVRPRLYVSSDVQTWVDAKSACEDIGMTLAKIDAGTLAVLPAYGDFSDNCVCSGGFQGPTTPIVDNGASGCTSDNQCSACQGDCDSDSDCQPGLKCWQRSQPDQTVPGCAKTGYVQSHGYCYDPTLECASWCRGHLQGENTMRWLALALSLSFSPPFCLLSLTHTRSRGRKRDVETACAYVGARGTE
jgi:hypothetical protein